MQSRNNRGVSLFDAIYSIVEQCDVHLNGFFHKIPSVTNKTIFTYLGKSFLE